MDNPMSANPASRTEQIHRFLEQNDLGAWIAWGRTNSSCSAAIFRSGALRY
jgi:hypothetical protein